MLLRFSLLSLLAISFFVNSVEETIKGCASLSLNKEEATKIAIIRAQAEWVKLHKGIKVSGKESAVLYENDVKDHIDQEITIHSIGNMDSFDVVKSKQLSIDSEPHICVYLKPKNIKLNP
ncbi:hypothetical protein [Colwellia sp. BRX8-9]|jgi:hypothetical protein|uniref:hypothetical protein n=1 Tax=Colwellia sp. BRX8-9 TaxID=2759831 RepID=UPI0015F491B7|nr:hypothetical protein [Colwellia sp. BRX8-9]MBA6348811.1 hypothetical protein [Colwellia sp. BRX8-9]